MTTPAANIDSGLFTDGSQYTMTVKDNGVIDIPYHKVSSGQCLTAWRAYIRPASVKSPMDASGWRKPTGYSLVSESSSFHGGGGVKQMFHDVIQKTLQTDFFYDGWQASWREQRLPIPGANSALERRATSSALLKLKNQSINFGVAFGEYKETAELISSVATRIGKSVRAFRSKNPRSWGQVVKNQTSAAINGRKGSPRGSGIPNAWLELQYGWNPMMADVDSAASQLSNSASSGHPFRCHVKGRAKNDLSAISWGTASSAANSGFLRQRSGTEFCLVRADYELASPLLATISSLGLTNPLEIVWELVPYSFVVDWFLPIGNWLSTMDADFGWRFLGGSVTLGNQYSVQGSGPIDRNINDPFDRQTFGGSCYSTQRVMQFVRRTYLTPPTAGLPTLKNPLSAGHVANALSLLAGAFR